MSRRRRLYDLKTVARTYASGHGRGLRQHTLSRSEWDISGTCERPVPVEMEGAAARLLGGHMVRQAGGAIHTLVLQTKCRRCKPCLKARATLWAYRAVEEINAAPRTWFATFTMRPEEHFRMRVETSRRLRAGGVEFETLSPLDAQRELTATYGAELTKYFKRVRKQSGVPLRYVLVQEAHLSGLPHFHALIHEVNPDEPLRHATLTSKWNLGYTKFKLCEGPRTAWYVAKYLAKTVLARVRASYRYGQDRLCVKRTKGTRDNPPPNREENKVNSLYCVKQMRERELEISNVNLDQSNHPVSQSEYSHTTTRGSAYAAPSPDWGSATTWPARPTPFASSWGEAYARFAALAKAFATTVQPVGLRASAGKDRLADDHSSGGAYDPMGEDSPAGSKRSGPRR